MILLLLTTTVVAGNAWIGSNGYGSNGGDLHGDSEPGVVWKEWAGGNVGGNIESPPTEFEPPILRGSGFCARGGI